MWPVFPGKRRFRDLSEQEILALAISSEEDDGRIYRAFASHLRADFPASAKTFDAMADEEGYIYRPNVSVVEEMANMISASRAYQNNVEVVNATRQMLSATINLGR